MKKLRFLFGFLFVLLIVWLIFNNDEVLLVKEESKRVIAPIKKGVLKPYDSSVFAVHFVDPVLSSSNNNVLMNKLAEFLNINESPLMKKQLQNLPTVMESFEINFDNNPGGLSLQESNDDSETSAGGLVIDDKKHMKEYEKNNHDSQDNSNKETIFVTDSAENQLISCRETNGKYNCHTAVNNFNNPQDVLVVNNYIYIVNSHPYGESGDIIKCNINNHGFIYSCGLRPIDIVNPAFFYYSPPHIYISEFVYSGNKDKPFDAIRCDIDMANGNLVNCIKDSSITSMAFVSKYNNFSFYRTYFKDSIAHIEKCDNLNSDYCVKMSNSLLLVPLSLSIYNDDLFISNAQLILPDGTSAGEPSILRCSIDLKKCKIIIQSIKNPMCIGVYQFENNNSIN